MQPRLMSAQVLGHVRPASTASKASGRFWRVFENLEQWYQTGGKCQNSDETFCVIFNNV